MIYKQQSLVTQVISRYRAEQPSRILVLYYKKPTTCQQKKTINYNFIEFLINNLTKFHIPTKLVEVLIFINHFFIGVIMTDKRFKIMNDLYGAMSELRDRDQSEEKQSKEKKEADNE